MTRHTRIGNWHNGCKWYCCVNGSWEKSLKHDMALTPPPDEITTNVAKKPKRRTNWQCKFPECSKRAQSRCNSLCREHYKEHLREISNDSGVEENDRAVAANLAGVYGDNERQVANEIRNADNERVIQKNNDREVFFRHDEGPINPVDDVVLANNDDHKSVPLFVLERRLTSLEEQVMEVSSRKTEELTRQVALIKSSIQDHDRRIKILDGRESVSLCAYETSLKRMVTAFDEQLRQSSSRENTAIEELMRKVASKNSIIHDLERRITDLENRESFPSISQVTSLERKVTALEENLRKSTSRDSIIRDLERRIKCLDDRESIPSIADVTSLERRVTASEEQLRLISSREHPAFEVLTREVKSRDSSINDLKRSVNELERIARKSPKLNHDFERRIIDLELRMRE